MSTILTGLLSFMVEKGPTLGSIETSDFTVSAGRPGLRSRPCSPGTTGGTPARGPSFGPSHRQGVDCGQRLPARSAFLFFFFEARQPLVDLTEPQDLVGSQALVCIFYAPSTRLPGRCPILVLTRPDPA